MIITKQYAKKLIKEGRATKENELKADSTGKIYIVITRHDLARTDHYLD